MTNEKGQWCARYKDGHRLTKYHFIESEIADREVTRCGRQMKTRAGTVMQIAIDIPVGEDACEICTG